MSSPSTARTGCSMNSDVTVFFLQVLPQLPAGVLVGIHDVLWPEDYLPMWADFLWSEQYLVAAWLLGGGAGMEIELPAHYVTQREAPRGAGSPVVGPRGARRARGVGHHLLVLDDRRLVPPPVPLGRRLQPGQLGACPAGAARRARGSTTAAAARAARRPAEPPRRAATGGPRGLISSTTSNPGARQHRPQRGGRDAPPAVAEAVHGPLVGRAADGQQVLGVPVRPGAGARSPSGRCG